MSDLLPIRTALVSVSDKAGLPALAHALDRHGARIVASGGSRRAILAALVPCDEISTWTGAPEAFGGRMKTLSFAIGAGLLFDRDRDAAEAEALGVRAIDLVVANLYPFEAGRDAGAPDAELVELIDIGGPTLIRAAAKNHRHVAVITHPDQIPELIAALDGRGGTTMAERRAWMEAAFVRTAAYDAAIAHHFAGRPLRYGENPHQWAAFVPDPAQPIDVSGGKALSYNNLLDLDAALAAVAGIPLPACAVVKHGNPCGLACAPVRSGLLRLAWGGDPVSAFGSVIAFNRAVEREDLEFLALHDRTARKFVEVVAAPGFDDSARSLLAQAPAVRVVSAAPPAAPARSARMLRFGTVVQAPDDRLATGYRFMSRAQPSGLDKELIDFGLHAARCLQSNAIVLVARDGDACAVVGIGAGQPNRLQSVELAIAAVGRGAMAASRGAAAVLRDAVLVSDAFFPFADGVEAALRAGVATIVEPGGSLRDAEVIAACDRAGAVLVFTGVRHFRH